MSIDRVIVVIPAHNEQRRIATAIAAVDRARACLSPSVTASIVIGADRCTDRTVARARALLGRNDQVIEVDHRCVGLTRHTATAAGLAATQTPLERVWIANTDADSIVPTDWLVQQLDLAAVGATAVAGIVALTADPCEPALLRRFLDSYVVSSDGSHPHVHGANLGVRADAYLAVGGWAALTTGEDHDLWNRLRGGGHRVVSTSSLVVGTSARLRGRAPAGFANELALHAGASR